MFANDRRSEDCTTLEAHAVHVVTWCRGTSSHSKGRASNVLDVPQDALTACKITYMYLVGRCGP